ncbi:YTH domain-containing protein [Artemisia annua]|uniref:YTH domain-containing family protein n=1 Tax=Artemisia annua TaxID=35608 RepID=A0A2U1P018_ARTAN|nr:YTH domain-containing protein [Artemisia annua]
MDILRCMIHRFSGHSPIRAKRAYLGKLLAHNLLSPRNHVPLSKVTVEVARILAGQIIGFAPMAGLPFCLIFDAHSRFTVLFTLRYSLRWRGSVFEIRIQSSTLGFSIGIDDKCPKESLCYYLTRLSAQPLAAGLNSANLADQSAHYPPTLSYDHHYAGLEGTYCQPDGSCHQNRAGASYMDNGSLMYLMPGYNPYGLQQSYLGEGMSGYSWNSAYTSEPKYQSRASWATKSTMGINSSTKSNGSYSKRHYPLDVQSRQSTSDLSQLLQSPHLCSLNQSCAACYPGGVAKGYQVNPNFASLTYQNKALFASYSTPHAPKVRESEELTCGPRSQSSMSEHQESKHSLKDNQYNLDGFQTNYEHAKFYIIKSYSEDDVHKCVKYDVWSSTLNGNKKLDAAFLESEGIKKVTGSKCPIFLFFSVNGSGQFVGVAEMMGPVVFDKDMDFWQLDKWSGFFPVKWHIIKDIPNTVLRHILLENNDNRPVTYTRDTQEVGLEQGLEMLEIFKSFPAKTTLLDDLSFYENREKLLKARRTGKAAFQSENAKSGEGSVSKNGSLDPEASLINLTRNLSLNAK